jgi:hypothetical protein
MFYLHLLADVSRWLDQRGLDASGLTDANASAFRQDRRSRGRARFRGTQGLARLLRECALDVEDVLGAGQGARP